MTGERIAVALLVVAALALRLPNLGRLGLVADEGHQALAVAGILEHGVPEVPSGSVYLRGTPFLYAEALVARLHGIDEWSLRLPAAVFGALTVILVFVYGRMMFGRKVGFIAAILLALSVWELELSRYARMYTLFQLGFLGSAIVFYRSYIEGRKQERLVALAIMGATLVTHQLGVFVSLLFLIPAFLPDEALPQDLKGRGRWRLLAPAFALVVLWAVYQRLEVGLMLRVTSPLEAGGAEAASPGGPVVEADGGGLRQLKDHLLVPEIALARSLLALDRPAVLIALALAAAPALAVASTLARPGRRLRAGWALTILAAAFLNQFAVVAWLAAGYSILLAGGLRELKRRPLAPALIGAAAFLLYWWAYLIGHPAARVTAWGETRSALEIFFGYPPARERVVSWFASGWPAMSAVTSATLVILFVRFARDRRQRASLFAAAAVLFPLLGVTMISDVYNESRYHFHLYPFLTVVFALSLSSIARFGIAAADTLAALAGRGFRARPFAEIGLIAALAFLISPDVAPGEIGSFLKRDYTTPKDPVRSILNWRPYAFFHQDHVGPAMVVRDAIQPGDLVVVAGPTYWLSIYLHYIGRLDYAVPGKTGRVVHHVTGVPCLSTPEELDQTLAAEEGRRLWILGDLNLLGDDSQYFSPEMKARLRDLAKPRVYLGRDLNTFVARRDPDRLPP